MTAPPGDRPPFAVVTPSYAGDLERCRLLCETLDRHAEAGFEHLVMVADADEPLFRPLAGPHRRILTDAEVLPAWLRPIAHPLRRGRALWISRSASRPVWPMSGWHVQQLRKIAAARHTRAPMLLMADSDTAFFRPVTAVTLTLDGLPRLYVRRGALRLRPDPADPLSGTPRHVSWARLAARLFSGAAPDDSFDDYIGNLVTWRRDAALAMTAALEARHGVEVEALLGRRRTFSEYALYGHYVDHAAEARGLHAPTPLSLCLTLWGGERPDAAALERLAAALEPQHVAVGLQSFIGVPAEDVRAWIARRLAERS
jgi:hypothetical protein